MLRQTDNTETAICHAAAENLEYKPQKKKGLQTRNGIQHFNRRNKSTENR